MNKRLKRIIISGIVSFGVNLILLVDSASRDPQAFELSTKDRIMGGLLTPAGAFAEWIIPRRINLTQIVVMFIFSFAFYLVMILALTELWAFIRKERQ
jgi:hypothetical protein